MSDITERAAAALDLLPEELREPAVAYLIEQADKFRALQRDIDKAIDSVDAGQVRDWDFADFLRRARIPRSA